MQCSQLNVLQTQTGAARACTPLRNAEHAPPAQLAFAVAPPRRPPKTVKQVCSKPWKVGARDNSSQLTRGHTTRRDWRKKKREVL